jgi:hypothetical protein
MRLMILLAAVAAAVAVTAESPFASNADSSTETAYLGLAVPIPDTIPALTLPSSMSHHIPNGTYWLTLVVDKKGHVKKLRFPADSAEYFAPVKEVYRQIHFRFLSGGKIGFPVNVPVALEDVHAGAKDQIVTMRFPISPDSVSDAPLLNRLFAENKIVPPAITYLPPVYYRLTAKMKPVDYATITARVSLDAAGTLESLEFPFPGGEGMTHPVQAALIHAAMTPALKKGKPFPCSFYITFRIFDNLRYPFTPFLPGDSAVRAPITGRYFMTMYLNERDIAIPPLPRRFADGVINAGVSTLGIIGTVRAKVMIDPDGAMGRVDIAGGQNDLAAAARRALQLTEWYPARDNRGETRWFSGAITVTLDGSSRVVYKPEWIGR